MAMVAGDPDTGLGVGVGLRGIALIQPLFWGSDPIGSEGSDPRRKAQADRVGRIWSFVSSSNPNCDDPRINPVVSGGPGLAGLGSRRVLVFVAIY
ncbi:hypothetical protein Tsubulata_010581 [Turnera subulata]|uniref:Uncharacterized protein n=1 Tax=Turnera subulata TaxID=218843 RepID=A0A9Q0JKS5_9ROSI|nr:hypothetical protein Tsubulata_010581 [Turnera subulata]